MITRPKCTIDGCNNIASRSGKYKSGTPIWRKLCIKHHRNRYNIKYKIPEDKVKSKLPNKCFICGWNLGSCDTHRIIFGCDGGIYSMDNVIRLCPNHHRLVHENKLLLK